VGAKEGAEVAPVLDAQVVKHGAHAHDKPPQALAAPALVALRGRAEWKIGMPGTACASNSPSGGARTSGSHLKYAPDGVVAADGAQGDQRGGPAGLHCAFPAVLLGAALLLLLLLLLAHDIVSEPPADVRQQAHRASRRAAAAGLDAAEVSRARALLLGAAQHL
jgi:hypothetical protein